MGGAPGGLGLSTSRPPSKQAQLIFHHEDSFKPDRSPTLPYYTRSMRLYLTPSSEWAPLVLNAVIEPRRLLQSLRTLYPLTREPNRRIRFW